MLNRSGTWLRRVRELFPAFAGEAGHQTQTTQPGDLASPVATPISEDLPKVYHNVMTLSIRQPWAWLIVHGIKDIENRTWDTKYRGPLLIHAGKALTEGYPDVYLDLKDEGYDLPDTFERGGIVGVVALVDVITKRRKWRDRWYQGPYGFVLANARPLPFLPMKGKLGLFRASYDIEATLGTETS